MHPISIKLILLFIFFVELPWIDVHLLIATIFLSMGGNFGTSFSDDYQFL